MAKINGFLNKIRTAIKGNEVRGSLADGLEEINKETIITTEVTEQTKHRQGALEQQFDDQIKNMTLKDPSSAELVAAQTNTNTGKKFDTIGRRLDTESQATTSEFNDRGINVKWFGAVGDRIADDTFAIQAAYNSLAEGEKLVIPKGRYLVNGLVFDRDDIFVEMNGVFVQKGEYSGTCIQIGSKEKRVNKNNFAGVLRVEKGGLRWDEDNTGVKLLNLYESSIKVDITGFAKGLHLEAIDNLGTVYNDISIVRLHNNQHNIHFSLEDGGWVNENKFFGGRFSWGSNVVSLLPGETLEECFERTGACHIYIEDKTMNQNIFFSPSLEGFGGKFFYNNGQYNTIYSPRMEAPNKSAILFHFGLESIYNDVISPYGPATDVPGTPHANRQFINEGSRNKIYGRNMLDLPETRIKASNMKLRGNVKQSSEWGAENDGVMDVGSTNSSADKVYVGRDVQENETFSVDGNGNAEFKRNVKANRGGTFKNTNGGTSRALEVVNTNDLEIFGISNNGTIVAKARASADYRSNFFIGCAIKTTEGPPFGDSPKNHDGTDAIGVSVLNTAENKLYFHMGSGVWRGITLT